MKKVLDVPFYSQYTNVLDPEWQNRACGIVCVKMVLEYLLLASNVTIESLIKEGQRIGAYNEGGWTHNGLTMLLRNHGVLAYPQEFKSYHINLETGESKSLGNQERMITDGLNKIVKKIEEKQPVIVTMDKKFDNNPHTHLIVITGFEEDDIGPEGFFYNDPNAKNGEAKKDKFVELDRFKKYWRNMAIFTE